jgi:hypothetical protein
VDRVLAERRVVAALAAGGNYEGPLPTVEAFDQLLGMTTEETPMDPEIAELRAALGLPA